MTHDLEGLLEEIGIGLGRSTDWEVYGFCPGHKERLGREDRRPTTWSVARTTGNHFCFSCGYGGTLPELIVEQVGGTTWGAMGRMIDHGMDPSDTADLPESFFDRRNQKPSPKHMDERRLDAFTEPPLKALRKRSLTPSAARHYGIRWSPGDKCWITPIRLVGGALIGWQAKGKRFFDNYPAKVPKSQTLFGADVFPEEHGTTAILMESPLDVPRLYAAGFEGGLAAFGVYVSDDQMRLLLSLTDELILALDNDDNGVTETHRLITGENLRRKKNRQGIAWLTKFSDLRVYNYGDSSAKDPGEQDDDEIEWGIENAIPAIDWSMP